MKTMQKMAYIDVRDKLTVVIYVSRGIFSNLAEGHGASIFKSIKLEVIMTGLDLEPNAVSLMH